MRIVFSTKTLSMLHQGIVYQTQSFSTLPLTCQLVHLTCYICLCSAQSLKANNLIVSHITFVHLFAHIAFLAFWAVEMSSALGCSSELPQHTTQSWLLPAGPLRLALPCCMHLCQGNPAHLGNQDLVGEATSHGASRIIVPIGGHLP